ncbi:MAG: SGNH/GDSL hydrolase family protein [Bacteroidetes bacterium]|nr:SGNH/GDSL hydrolase family protein [Bacteroidota bacterium]
MRSLILIYSLFVLLACAKQDAPPTSKVAKEASKTYRYLALGDSYTIGTAIGPENSYAAILGDSLAITNPEDSLVYEVIAKNGWTTKDLLQGISASQPDSSFDVVSILIGVNNQYQRRSIAEYESEFKILLGKAASFGKQDYSNVVVISIPDWGVSPAGAANRAQVASEIDAFNAAQKLICDTLGVRFIDITPLSRTALNNAALIASDGLHFSSEMHRLWTKLIFEDWKERLSDD